MDDHKYNDATFLLEEAFWKSYAANSDVDDPDRIDAYMGHFPHGGVSGYLLDHVGQQYKEQKIQSYDNNLLRDTKGNEHNKKDINNIIYYGSRFPPEFNFNAIGEVNVPIHMFTKSQD